MRKLLPLRKIPLALSRLACLLFLFSCTQDSTTTPVASATPRLRVLVFEQTDHVDLSLTSPPGPMVNISLASDGWHIRGRVTPSGPLHFSGSGNNTIRLNGADYHGSIDLLPLGAGKFDVINVVNVEDYLAGVITEEMYPNWPIEAIKAQAVASRTYALYEARTSGSGRSFDVFADQRSQMYGGVRAETAKSRQAAAETAGVVLTYGPGDGTIFRAYFSSCCGGVTQSVSDAFPGERDIPPLAAHFNGDCCSGSKYFNWGPITIKKTELARRFHLWAERQTAELGRPVPELNIAGVYRIDLQASNRYGRPTRVLVTDSRGLQYSWAAEQLRSAVNADARPGTTLPSSFCKISSDPASDSVTFYDGHGFGHGVGMCQWCAEARAAAGQTFAQILASAYPEAKLVRAY
jgi:stage II sporulation protein D